jgi:hypothetical protein
VYILLYVIDDEGDDGDARTDLDDPQRDCGAVATGRVPQHAREAPEHRQRRPVEP